MYKIKYHKQVVKFLQNQNKNARKNIIEFFDKLKQNPFDFKNYDVKPLKGFENSYRLRFGKYRVIFTIKNDELLIEVIKAGSRGDVYK